MAITCDINDHECCREIAKSPLHSLENGGESIARDKLILISPANENGNHPPPAPPPTSRNEPPFLRRSQRQTQSKYKSQTLAQPQQPPTSANTPPLSSPQQPSPTVIATPSTANSKLSSQANQPPASSPQPIQAIHHSGEHPTVAPDLVNGFSPQANQPPASSPQPTQATHHSGDHPIVTAPIHHQNQPILYGYLPQDLVQATTTNQQQSPHTQTTPTRQKTTCKSQASIWDSAHGQLQLPTESQLHTTTTEPSQSHQTSNQHQLKSLHVGGNSHAHGTLSATQDLCSPCMSPTSTFHAPHTFPTSQTQAQSISKINPNTQPSRMPSTLLLNNLQNDPLIQNTNQPTSALSYASDLKYVPNLNQNKPTKISLVDIMNGLSNSRIPIKTVTLFEGEPNVQFSTTEIQAMVIPFKLILVGKFSYNRPSMELIHKFFNTLRLKGTFKVSPLDNRHVLIQLDIEEDYSRLWVRQT
ncbi:pollen-specific leucine-rich repeat extensin-like protein 2 [Citrus sinensis]|uniref:pollen-specific leucine-rich repeat extensin-like protein 2 n=1 Tax=Citrus sinensis TaxID=2711 RepID=UPI0022796A3E|nr:pollen-specific leucine-rich repeat extensin-like protein 2 [Citrus sinensis]XP_052300314.1 pollen-specific leucine-rich repeat extensin-like protein 2 [Citrus sinensis]